MNIDFEEKSTEPESCFHELKHLRSTVPNFKMGIFMDQKFRNRTNWNMLFSQFSKVQTQINEISNKQNLN